MLSIKPQNNETTLERVYAHFDIDVDDAFAEEKLHTALRNLEQLKTTQAQSEKEIERLQKLMDQLSHDIVAIQHSRAWKISFMIMTLAKRLLGRKRGGDGFARITQTIELYEHWKKARD